jgi:lipopolysaccharide biosynthesis glycosyltransferase
MSSDLSSVDYEVVLCLNRKMQMGAFVAASSLVRWIGADCRVKIHFVAFDWPESVQRRLAKLMKRKNTTIQFHTVSRSVLAGVPVCGKLGLETYIRLMLPECLAESSSVLYLDSDTLVRAAIGWTPLSNGECLAAAPDFKLGPSWRPGGLKTLPERPWWFNAGIMILNLEAWRANSYGSALIRWLRENPGGIEIADQEAVNACLWEQTRELPAGWNYQLAHVRANAFYGWPSHLNHVAEQVRRPEFSPTIVHYVSNLEKPWRLPKSSPYVNEWLEELETSGYFDSMIEKRGFHLRRIGSYVGRRYARAVRVRLKSSFSRKS